MAARHDDTGDGPDPADRDRIAERWAEIIADLGPLDPGEHPSTTAADDGAGPTAADDGAGPAVTYPVAPWVSAGHVVRAPSGRDWSGTDDIDAAEAEVDDHEHFVPPEPGPVLGGDPLLTMAWLGAAGVPVGLLVVMIVWPDAPAVLTQAAGVVFALGCGLLVWRMPHHRDDDDDSTGAVV